MVVIFGIIFFNVCNEKLDKYIKMKYDLVWIVF